jgi:hypothetical protein
VAVSKQKPKVRRTPAPKEDRANGAGTEAELRKLLAALKAAHAGDFDARIETGQGGVVGELAEAFNTKAASPSARRSHVPAAPGRKRSTR